MRGLLIRSQPMDPLLLEAYDNIRHILNQVGWMEYIQRLQGYDNEVVSGFNLNFKAKQYMVVGTLVEVTKETVAQVASLPKIGERLEKHW